MSRLPVVSSRAELEAWLGRVRAEFPALTVTCSEAEEHGNGAVCELIVTQEVAPQEVWRVVLAIRVEDHLIREVRTFWGREPATDWLAAFW